VGFETGDDAAVYRIGEGVALVLTVDFFPPIVDDPYAYGQISAANSISDVYAMGGRPIAALAIAAFPRDLPPEVIGKILAGGADKAAEAGIAVVGGHTVNDDEPKYGLAVIGTVKPGRQVTNTGARPGDRLILTKALGTGVITTAARSTKRPPAALKAAVESMSLLNKGASEAMVAVGVDAATDITGFGLTGHLHTMMLGSKAAAQIYRSAVPVLPGTMELITGGFVSGGTVRNLEAVAHAVTYHPGVPDPDRILLSDAQTSGGLLMSVPQANVDALTRELKERGTPHAAIIGEVVPGDAGHIFVER
jgi:selenide,water dikinase